MQLSIFQHSYPVLLDNYIDIDSLTWRNYRTNKKLRIKSIVFLFFREQSGIVACFFPWINAHTKQTKKKKCKSIRRVNVRRIRKKKVLHWAVVDVIVCTTQVSIFLVWESTASYLFERACVLWLLERTNRDREVVHGRLWELLIIKATNVTRWWSCCWTTHLCFALFPFLYSLCLSLCLLPIPSLLRTSMKWNKNKSQPAREKEKLTMSKYWMDGCFSVAWSGLAWLCRSLSHLHHRHRNPFPPSCQCEGY